MTRIILALILALAASAFIGCKPQPQPTPWTPPAPPGPVNPNPPPPVDPTPIPAPSVITEAHNGKTFKVTAGSTLKVSLTTNPDPNYFWSVGIVSGDFDVLTDVKSNGKETFTIQCSQSGNIRITYTQFTESGAKVLNEVTYGVVVQ